MINDYIDGLEELRIETSHAVLRPLTLEDHALWRQAWVGLGPAQTTWDEGAKLPEECTEAVYAGLLDRLEDMRRRDHTYSLGVFSFDERELVGNVALMDIVRGVSQNAYLGYRIFHTHWRQGYAFEAARHAMALGFDRLHLHRIEAGIEPENEASRALADKLSLRYEGTARRRLFKRGVWIDLCLYAMTVEEWDALEDAPFLVGT